MRALAGGLIRRHVGQGYQALQTCGYKIDVDLAFTALKRLTADKPLNQKTDVRPCEHPSARVGCRAMQPVADGTQEALLNEHVEQRRGAGRCGRAQQELKSVRPRFVGMGTVGQHHSNLARDGRAIPLPEILGAERRLQSGDKQRLFASEVALHQCNISASLASGTPLTVQWMVHHPNHSGLAMNQATRQFTPAQFVRSVRLWQGERLLLSAEVDFALSENPTLRFRFVPRGTDALRAEAVDTFDRRFSGSIALKDLR